ncbi:beta-ketoacyl-ACP synthase [Granulosicoccus antarcticus]|uniref:3-oxoacyl-[acyl-carrier-protein] synthase 2 n=1 Tax=Granulosicoccus antarcticus IMCC3135 TaxID=1192854 RepID=A0A2Z2P000_9GAMM|nr:beta-ketoacyl-ACP synthase [Granulosicoccus antarcticus]ASJ76859.1 3-oxoacyl-[acyl-carrier-protein] synthase 2 [Granulosicoccus antarcticus IMCC3135]
MSVPAPSFCRLHPPAIVCPLGSELPQIRDALFSGRDGLQQSDRFTPDMPQMLGYVDSALPDITLWPVHERSRNNALLSLALDRLMPQIDQYRDSHPEARIAVVMGTSTSGIGEAEQAINQLDKNGDWPEEFHYSNQELGAPALFIKKRANLQGPAYTISTACTSSARALASAQRLLQANLCDAVITGGADSLCGLTIQGFRSLEAVSDSQCRPFGQDRNGINLGEAAVLFLMTAEPGGMQLLGYGESSDAHHISAPAPDGHGASAAMQAAIDMAGLKPEDVGYVNLHGTATRLNDSMEATAMQRIFGSSVLCSSTKTLTGHTLGACGALEAAFCWLALESGQLPAQQADYKIDPKLPSLNLTRGGKWEGDTAMSNSYAFGGNNIALLIKRSS